MSKERWGAELLPDLTGKVAIITGANTGLGKETAHKLAAANATVILAVRSQDKGDAAAADIVRSHPSAKVVVKRLDLSSLESVKSFCADITEKLDHLDILINNAGVMMPPYSLTPEGFEMQLGTNHLGHFALTISLLPLLRKTDQSRVVILSSLAHKQAKLDLNDPNWRTRKYNAGTAYSDSKFANALFAVGLAEKLKGYNNHPLVTAAHPGITQTDLTRHSSLGAIITNLLSQSVQMGALPTLRAATEPNASPGDFFGPKGLFEMKGHPIKVEFSPKAKKTDAVEKLWAISEQLTGLKLRDLI